MYKKIYTALLAGKLETTAKKPATENQSVHRHSPREEYKPIHQDHSESQFNSPHTYNSQTTNEFDIETLHNVGYDYEKDDLSLLDTEDNDFDNINSGFVDPIENNIATQNYVPDPRDEEMMSFVDTTGQSMQVTRREWRTRILPYNLQENWHNPEILASFVTQALHDEFFAEIDAASERLVAIDVDHERAICVRSIVLMRLHKNIEAEYLLLTYLQTYPKTGVVLTNLAKSRDAQGNHDLAMATLEEGLTIDPNQENGLDWWLSLYQEKLEQENIQYESLYLMAITEADRKFGGWRIKLKLGSYYAEQKQLDTAKHYFAEVVHQDFSHDALSIISGDLGKNGFISEMIEMTAPYYISEQHDVYAGLNLLNGYLMLQRADEGEHLLEKMQNLNNPAIENYLTMFQQEFVQLKKMTHLNQHDSIRESIQLEDSDSQYSDNEYINTEYLSDEFNNDEYDNDEYNNEEEITENPVNMPLIAIDEPLWLRGLGYFKNNFELHKTGKRIALMQFTADQAIDVMQESVSMNETMSRLAKTIPLYLQETLYLGSTVSPIFISPEPQSNLFEVVNNELITENMLSNLVKNNYSGVLAGQFTENKLILTYHDLEQESQQSVTVDLDYSQPEYAVQQALIFLMNTAQINFDADFQYYGKGFSQIPIYNLNQYLDALAQFYIFMQFSERRHLVDKNHSEHRIIRSILDCAIEMPFMQTQLLLISVVGLCLRNYATAIKSYKNQILSWLDSHAAISGEIQEVAKQMMVDFHTFCGG